jgi:uncharacterized membrane protein (UPF0127 family)
MIHVNLRPLRTAALWLAAAFSTLAGGALAQEAQRLPRVVMHAGMHNISAEVAQAPDERQIGLMYRRTMPANDGMLFVFEDAQLHCFWMKNTLLPLSIAFLADDGRIVNIEDMAPNTEESHCPKQKVRYALEMNQGWFAKRGFKAGMKLDGEPFGRR